MRLKSRKLAAALLVLGAAAFAQDKPKDALAPRTTGEDARIRQLHTVTICTADLDATLRFYRDALGLSVRGPLELTDVARKQQRALWDIPEEIGWQLYVLHRPDVAGTIQIRLLVLDQETPLVHSSYDPMEPGPFSLGFPTLDLRVWEPEIRERGFGSLNVREEYQVPRPDGSKYWIHETIFNGPDFVHAVGISRKDGMAQLGPVDAATGRGGPVYSAQSIERSDKVLAFYTDVLGLELRSDREWKSAGTKGALNVPDGTVFRFSIVYAQGATSGHLLFIDFRDAAKPPTGVAPRPPHRGLVMWSFPVKSVPEIERRARSAGVPIVGGPVDYESPELGAHRAITLQAPDGFLVELFDGGEGKPFAGVPLLRAP